MKTFGGPILKDIIGWDINNWSACLHFWEHTLFDVSGYKTLELGAKHGGLSLYFSLQGAQDVVCSDLNNPKVNAEPIHEKYKAPNISYVAADGCHLPFSDETLDLVCFKSVLGGVRKGADRDKKKQMIAEIYRVLKPGGYLVFAENLRGHALHMFLRRRAVRWSSGWEYLTLTEIKEYLKEFKTFQFERYGYLGLLGRSEYQRHLLASLDKKLTRLPKEWCYILSGVAQK